ITDGTANNGSDTINFASTFKNINAIELDPINFKVLMNNVKIYKCDNVKLFNGDSLNLVKQLKQDVIYLDLPWGGPEYKTKYSVQLFLSKLELSDVYLELKSYAKFFVFKVPKNYDF